MAFGLVSVMSQDTEEDVRRMLEEAHLYDEPLTRSSQHGQQPTY
jgi:hypothetical protein